MTVLTQSLRSISTYGLNILIKLRFILIGLIVIGMGGAFGYLSMRPTMAELILSITVVILLFVLIAVRMLNGVLVWLFFTVFIDSWIEIPMGAGIPDLSFSRFVIGFLGVLILAQASIGKFQFKRITWSEILIIVAVLGIVSAAPYSIAPGPTGVIQWSLTMHFAPLIIYFFTKNLVKDRKDLHQVLGVIALLGFVSGLYTIYEYTTGDVWFLPKGKDVHRLFRGGDEAGIRLIQGLMGGSGPMGRALATTIPVTFYMFLEHKKVDLWRFALGAMLIIQFVGIVIPLSRTPWYALMIALFVMQIFYPQFRKVFIAIVFAGVIIIFGTWDQVSQSQAASRLDSNEESLDGRESRWTAGVNMFKAKPLRGWGFGRYEAISGRFRTDGSRANFDAVENDYLYIAVGSGLVGLMPYILLIAVLLVYSLQLFFKARAPDWSGFIKAETLTVFWAVIICLLLTSYTAKQVQPVIKLMTFAVAGSIVGTHEYLLRETKEKVQTLVAGKATAKPVK